MAESGMPLVTELYGKMCAERLRPKTIVDYTREPFVYAPGNVRVTLDYNIRTGLSCTDFLNVSCPTSSTARWAYTFRVTANSMCVPFAT